MGKLNLGLDDRSARLIHGRDVWTEIRGLLSGYNAISAAIAFVGPEADQHLPLRGPATIVVNAGDDALASGWTDPEVLLRWTRRGVRVYSLTSLHAKVLLAEGYPSFVLIGSADVLSTSGRILDEAVLVADERETVDELREAIAGWRERAGEPLTEAWLQAAASRYRPAAPHRLPTAERAAATPTPAVQGPPVSTPGTAQPAPVQNPAEAAGIEVKLPVATAVPEVHSESATQQRDPAPVAEIAPPALAPPALAPAILAPPEIPPPADDIDDRTDDGRLDATAAEHARAQIAAVQWPRPKYIYLATLTKDGRPSDSAQDRLDQLRQEHRVPTDGRENPLLEVEMFWWDEPARAGSKSSPSYREGWHVVPISVTGAGRPAVSSQVDSPGRVLNSYTDYGGGPARTYYYLLRHCAGTPTTFRKLREALTAVGEKPTYDHAYMMQHKVDAILDLWPQIRYTG